MSVEPKYEITSLAKVLANFSLIMELLIMIANAIHSESPKGYCAPYTGLVCKRYIPSQSFVYYNQSDDDYESLLPLNEQLAQTLWSELVSSLSEPCRSAAQTLLCYYAFPQCQWSDGSPVSRPLCREDCVAAKESLCSREWTLLEDTRQRGIYFKSRGHFRLADCDSLPSHRNRTDSQCSRAGLTELDKQQVSYDCVKGRGRYYQGMVNVTKHGIPCQRWDSQSPHTHNSPPFVFPEIWNSENYCRNAGGEESTPWCYTIDPTIRFQYCDIKQCDSDKYSSSKADNQTFIEILSSIRPIIYPSSIPILSPFSITIFGCLIVIVLIICRLNKKRRKGYNTVLTIDVDIDLDKLPVRTEIITTDTLNR